MAAVDVSPDSLAWLRSKLSGLGLGGRVSTVEADLDAGWPDLGRFDLTWAWFARLAPGLGDRLEPGDRAVLATLLDQDGPQSLSRRTDLHIRGVRSVTLGRRG